MSLQGHLSELERRHQAVERELHAALRIPALDHLKIKELKRKKLLLKDEITRLKNPPTMVAHKSVSNAAHASLG